MKTKDKKQLKPISAVAFERERDALSRLLNLKVITVQQHADMYETLVERLKV